MFIGNQFVPSSSGTYFPVRNPATEEVIAEVAEGAAEDVDRAVAAAERGFTEWAHKSPYERGRVLSRMARALEADADAFAALETRNQGKPIRHAKGFDIPNAIETLDYYAGATTKLHGTTIDTGPAMHTFVRREPYGVVGQIIPWNYPLMMAAWKIAPALAAGNAVVIKPAPYTPLTLLKLAGLARDAGLPAGVLNVVTGFGPVVGRAITRHPGIAKIAFTGSTATGRDIVLNASETHKPVVLELGGKSANIFFDDVDLPNALKRAVLGVFHNAGQMCIAGSRLLLHEKIHDEFVQRMAAFAKTMRIGDPRDEKTQLGPVVAARQMERVLGFVSRAKAAGATVVTGGRRAENQNRGYFVEPTILTGVDHKSEIAQEEVFGPVVAAFKFRDEDEALALANDSKFGLAAGIHTNDLARAHRLAAGIKAGTIWVNTYAYLSPAVPYGGYRQSGYGRELGQEGIDNYTQLKAVFISPNRG
ncbi:MAG: aldehyde dehydrogenase family protein [Alphaproteobacteria bacterium]|nr:aldehyde dehydrogenase family protein [Alphaproteobacteria bacterium]